MGNYHARFGKGVDKVKIKINKILIYSSSLQ